MSTHRPRLLIVDDEPPARKRLRAMLAGLVEDGLIDEASSGAEALILAQRQMPDIVLMDICLPGIDGLQAAAELSRLAAPPAIIFCTAYDEHALAAFKSQAIDYLLKPVKREHLSEALSRAARLNRAQLAVLATSTQADEACLLVKTRGVEERFKVAEIRAFIADKKYVSAYLPGRELILEESLKVLLDRYQGLFMRVHRNALVAERHIEALHRLDGAGGEQMVLRLNGVAIRPVVSRRLLPAVRRMLRGR